MQVKKVVVRRVKVNVMHDLARLCASELPMFPLTSIPLAAIAKPMRLDESRMRSVCLFDGWSDGWRCLSDLRNRRHHPVSTPFVFTARKTLDLLRIDVERVSMPMPHLVVAGAHFPCGDRAITVLARAANYLSAPTILGRSVFLDPFVVHQAKTIRGVLSTATGNAANLVENWRRHSNPASLWLPKRYHDKALGNSMAIPPMRWIGERIQSVDELLATMTKCSVGVSS